MSYVDGFVLPLPRQNLESYREMAEQAGAIWREHGALAYRECVGEDLDVGSMPDMPVVPFTRTVDAKPGETVVFAWIVYESRAHRDEVNSKVMADPRMAEIGAGRDMPFDAKRMAYGGFETLVDL